MKYFQEFSSNTYAGSANQLFFNMPEGEVKTGRVFYKISVGGKYDYSILFSNIIDSTYATGTISHRNLICNSWTIHTARVGKCKEIRSDINLSDVVMADGDESKSADIVVSQLKELSFDGKKCKVVMPGEFFSSDPIELEFNKAEYLCLEITFSGKMIPYHEETLLPVFVKDADKWNYSKFMPFAGMIGCNRSVDKRVAYFGDSITQGIGTEPNSYLHWNARLSEKIGSKYSYWNLGIGFAKANDAASDGAWLYKAKQNDIIFVCFGVNDILQRQPEEQIKSDLTYIVDVLKKEGKKVILQTVPPFDYKDESIEKWKRINSYILTVLKDKADYVFDNTHFLGEENAVYNAKYGGHPNADGCKIWAEALFEEIKKQGIL